MRSIMLDLRLTHHSVRSWQRFLSLFSLSVSQSDSWHRIRTKTAHAADERRLVSRFCSDNSRLGLRYAGRQAE